MTVPTATPVPASHFAAIATPYGLMQTDATRYSAASRHPCSRSASVSTGCNSEWSIIRASSAYVGVLMVRLGAEVGINHGGTEDTEVHREDVNGFSTRFIRLRAPLCPLRLCGESWYCPTGGPG